MARGVELYGAAEIQERLGISRQRAYVLISRRDFPAPIASLKMGNVWLKDDVERWIAEKRPHLLAQEDL
ncbi:helix-turn-helix transcriptional regulator [Micromonospora sp. NPDC049836]|uniref:helix-turn-helix transcriptional regulator n=1 Tax=Micromonospora sp. NPDC049836 TaxID=3364274 RepID=UPI0037B656A8